MARLKKIWFPWVPLVVLLCAAACEDMCTKACGGFTFHDLGITDTSDVNGWSMNLDFNFTPKDCGSSCTCATVCYMQMVHNVDIEDGSYLYPSSEKEDRATTDGWYIDRVEGKIWGYYGRNDDGSFASYVTPGSETSTATMGDAPSRSEGEPWINFWWIGISVPVCIEDTGSSCNDHLLGYYEWGWKVDDAGAVTTLNTIAPTGIEDAFDDAVSEWNTQAPTLGKNTFPAFTRL